MFDSFDRASHVEPLQQPAHDIPPQLHDPLAQDCPEPQALQAAPPVPHSAADCEVKGTQVLPLQHPPGHDAPSQTHCPVVLLHSWPVAHAPQVAPPVPQEAFVSEAYASHVPPVPPLQQPFGQLFASHAQRPSVVSQMPLAQAAHAAPPAPHWEADCDEYRTQVLPLQQPFGHDVASQTQAPLSLSHS